jgi:hypothetical protein
VEPGNLSVERGEDLVPEVGVRAVVEGLASARPGVGDGQLDVFGDAGFVGRAEVRPEERGFQAVVEGLCRFERDAFAALESVVGPCDEVAPVADAVVVERGGCGAVGCRVVAERCRYVAHVSTFGRIR